MKTTDVLMHNESNIAQIDDQIHLPDNRADGRQTTNSLHRLSESANEKITKQLGSVIEEPVQPVIESAIPEEGSESTGNAPGAILHVVVNPSFKSSKLNNISNPNELYIALSLVTTIAVIFILGRIFWNERYYTPEEGLGYQLGLVGGIMMLFALVYSLFKYIKLFRSMMKLKFWLRMHIFFGVLGPVLVLFHSTFRIGSLNAGVALVSMLLVFLSGVIGRYLYTKVHYGLGGRKADFHELHALLKEVDIRFRSKRLDRFEQKVLCRPNSTMHAGFLYVLFWFRSRWLVFRLNRELWGNLKNKANEHHWNRKELRGQRQLFKAELSDYIQLLSKVSLFNIYERFFSFWRHAHVPFLFLLVLSTVVHVIAVHIY